MSQPRLIGEIIADILNDLRAKNLDAVFEAEFADVTDFLRIPSIRGMELELKIGNGSVIPHRLNGRTYVKRTDLETIFGTSDFSLKLRRRHD